jgi:1-acyl-sn-glycerol-3-phosphate acyltransferase
LHILYALAIAVSYPWLSLALQRRILQSWSCELLDILGIELLIDSDDPLHAVERGLIVTNHVSWLDVFVLNAVVPMRFVAKSEVRSWPLIGWLCARAQTLFIERGKARSAARINTKMVEMLQRGECLAVFPEGTTTDGAQVAHFHSSLLQPAIDAGVQVQAIALRYQDPYGQRSAAAAYIDEISFGESMWMILSARHLQVRLVAAAPLTTAGADRRSLTQHAHHSIAASLQLLEEAAHPALHDTDMCTPSLHCLLLSPPLTRELASARH